MNACRLVIALTVLPRLALAAEPAPGPDFAALAARTVLSLLLVIAIALIAAYLLRRLHARVPGHGQRLRLLESVPVGLKEKVVLLAVGEEQVLLGVAPGSVRLLHRLDQPLAVPEAARGEPGFASLLQRLRQRV